MKKGLLGLIVVLAFVGSAFAGSDGGVVTPADYNADLLKFPSALNVQTFTLTKGTSDTSRDSLTAAKIAIYKPLAIAASQFKVKPKYFRFFAGAGVVATGDSIELSYQLLPTGLLSDTTATWTVADTFSLAGKFGNIQNISTSPGVAIVCRVKNIDATGVLIAKPIRVSFLSDIVPTGK
jgi:hypothetical protein